MTSMLPSNRVLFAAIALITAASMAFALYLQYVVELSVCPLCLTQRVFVIGTGVVGLIAALHNPGPVGSRGYGLFGMLMAGIGAGFAGRHVWLQHLPPEDVPACGPSLEYMLQTLPFSETLTILLMGDGNCAETVWTLLGFSIPEMTLGLFVGLLVGLAVIVFRPTTP